jgi:scyllo-inositol 2-dehydrogenase (NADP+)
MRTAALIGFGTAGEVFHAPLLRANPDLAVIEVVTSLPGRAAKAAASFPGVKVVPSPKELSWRADLTVIATPHGSHIRLARAALEAGSWVVVDKPLSAEVSDAAAFAAELDANRWGDRVAVFHNRRWDGDFRTVRALVEQGRLGRVHRIESRFERWRPQPRLGSWRELASRSDGGGVLFDLGPHLVDQALVLFGPVASVYGEISSRRPGVSAGDDLFLALQHESGAVSHLLATALAADDAPRFRVRGDAGAFVKHGMDVQEAQLRAGVDPSAADFGHEAEIGWGTLGDGTTAEKTPTLPGRWAEFYVRVAMAMKREAPTPVPVAEAVNGLRVLAAAEKSAMQNRVVELDEAGSEVGTP